MAKFVLSAFADEYSPSIDEQIIGLQKNGVEFMEIRGVDGTNIADISLDKAKEVKAKLDAGGIRVSSMGSPIGKIDIADDFEAHKEKLRHVIDLAHIFECDRIRMFSFYHKNVPAADARGPVMDRLAAMLDIARAEQMILCHENECNIYGDIAERCLDIQKEFNGEIKCIFDHANFICSDCQPFPYAFDLLKPYIFYLHIKDASADKQMMPAGGGIGRIPETLDALREVDHTFFLTVEPHLRVFKGLEKLENRADGGKVRNQFATAEEAFACAVSSIKQYI